MKQIGDITLIKLLGKGVFGEVYLSYKKSKKNILQQKKFLEKLRMIQLFKNILRMK